VEHFLGKRSQQLAVRPHHKEIRGRAFGKVAVFVDQDDLVITRRARTGFRHHRRGVVRGDLCLRRNDVVATIGALLLDPELHILGLRRWGSGKTILDVRLRIVGGDREGHVGVHRDHVDLDRRKIGADLDRPGAGVGPHGGSNRLSNLLVGLLERQAHQLTGLKEALDMLPKPEDSGPSGQSSLFLSTELVNGHVVEDQRPALKRVREHVHRRIRPGTQFAIDPHQAVGNARTIGCQRLLSPRRAGLYQMNSRPIVFLRHVATARGYLLVQGNSVPHSRAVLRGKQSRGSRTMTQAIRKASNTLVIAARFYKELAISASDLLRPDTYRNL
jgi:hypothetical protein